jgi:hypothetical protein
MILMYIAENPQTETKDNLKTRVWLDTENNKLRGSGARKRKRAMSTKRNAKRNRKTKWALPELRL